MRATPHFALRRIFLAACTLMTLGLGLQPADAAPGDENWGADFGFPGAYGGVYASVFYDGQLVVGGDFSAIGGQVLNHLAAWDGSGWAALGETFDASVYALVEWNGDLYAGGDFNAAGATTLAGLTRWNGSAWVDVGGGVVGSVEDLAVWNNKLVVAGYFDAVDGGGVPTGYVAAWNGSSWEDLDGGTDGFVTDVESYGGALYACGEFTIAGSAGVANLARWNGTAWSSVGGGLSDDTGDPYNAFPYDMAVYDGKLVVAGAFLQAGALAVDGLVAWNGSIFSTLGVTSFGGETADVGRFGANLLVGDSYGNLKIWNGSFWSSLGYTNATISTSAEDAGVLYIGGSFTTLSGSSIRSLARYDGTWSAMAAGQGANFAVNGLHSWNGELVAGGVFTQIGDLQGSTIARWDGTAWQPLGTGIPYLGGGVVAMATFEGDLVVGGSFTMAGGVSVNKLARWDGTSWSAMGPGSGTSVAGLLSLGSELYATGYWGGVQTLGRWNGSDFVPLGTSINGSTQLIFALASYQGDPVMGGSFTSVDGMPANYIARWDGTDWQTLGSGTNGQVWGIHEMGGDLYVAGGFTQAGGVPASNIARWDGSAWSALGAGLYGGRVFDITSLGGDIYATGEFTQAGGQSAAYIARWDGVAWHSLGTGLNAKGAVLEAWNGKMFVGGDFTQAGNSGAAHLANWSVAASPVPIGDSRAMRIFMGPGRPNPFTGSTSVAFSLPAAADVTADVYDVRGARVRTIAQPGMSAGRQIITWDGRNEAGAPSASGVYFITVRDGVSAARQRVTLVR